jgi:hypothetical protein
LWTKKEAKKPKTFYLFFTIDVPTRPQIVLGWGYLKILAFQAATVLLHSQSRNTTSPCMFVPIGCQPFDR